SDYDRAMGALNKLAGTTLSPEVHPVGAGRSPGLFAPARRRGSGRGSRVVVVAGALVLGSVAVATVASYKDDSPRRAATGLPAAATSETTAPSRPSAAAGQSP